MASVWLFAAALAGYAVAAALHVAVLRDRASDRLTARMDRLAWTVHTLSLVARVAETGRPPILGLFEVTLFLTWVVMFNYLLIDRLLGVPLAGMVVTPAVAVLLTVATALPKVGPSAVPGIPAALLWAHIPANVIAYGLFALAAAMALLYLIGERRLRVKYLDAFFHRLPSLETLDRLSYRLVSWGQPLLTFGLVTGAFLVHATTGTFWAWDWKVSWSLAVWAVYGAYLLFRAIGWTGRRTAWINLIGFAAIVVNYLVVNLVLTRFHRLG